MTKQRSFINTATHSENEGEILVLPATAVSNLYNVYGLYAKNSDPNDESEPEYKIIQGENYLVDSSRQEVIFNGVGNVSWGDTLDLFSSEDGQTFTPIADITTELNVDAHVYIYWDGHNHACVTLKSDNGDCEWSEITDELGDDFEARLVEESATGGHDWTTRTVLYRDGITFYKQQQSRFSGSLDTYRAKV